MRRLIGGIALVLFLLRPSAAFCAEAVELTERCSIEVVAGRDDPFSLLDRNRVTVFRSSGDTKLLLTCETPIAQLYLIWDTKPGPYTVTAGEKTLFCGEYGFLHEYIALGTPTTSITLTLPEDSFTLCDIYAFGEGDLPFWVEVWEPPLVEADLLVLPTHAGDEHLFFGGTLPFYDGELGLRVQTAYLTNPLAEPHRAHELLFGLWAVGVRNYPIISDYPDMTVRSPEEAEEAYDREEITSFITGLLRRLKPQVVVGNDANGAYGHAAHMLTSRCLLDAAAASPNESLYPESAAEYGIWEVPKVYLHLYPENEIVMDWDVYLPSFGMTAYEAASAGYHYHKSQQDLFEMEHWGSYDCRKFGLAHTTVGLDVVGNDFFENTAVSLTQLLQPEPEAEPEPSEPEAPDVPDGTTSSPVSLLSVIFACVAILASALMVIVAKRRR